MSKVRKTKQQKQRRRESTNNKKAKTAKKPTGRVARKQPVPKSKKGKQSKAAVRVSEANDIQLQELVERGAPKGFVTDLEILDYLKM